MNDWQWTWLGRRYRPCNLSDFELEALLSFTGNERRVIEERRPLALRLTRELQIGFLGMTGRQFGAVRMVPAAFAAAPGYAIQCHRPGCGVAVRDESAAPGTV